MQKIAATINEAVQITGMSRASLYRAIKENKIPMQRNGGRTLLLVSDLEKFLLSLPSVEA